MALNRRLLVKTFKLVMFANILVQQTTTGIKCYVCSTSDTNEECNIVKLSCQESEVCQNTIRNANGLHSVEKQCKNDVVCSDSAMQSDGDCGIDEYTGDTCHYCCSTELCNVEPVPGMQEATTPSMTTLSIQSSNQPTIIETTSTLVTTTDTDQPTTESTDTLITTTGSEQPTTESTDTLITTTGSDQPTTESTDALVTTTGSDQPTTESTDTLVTLTGSDQPTTESTDTLITTTGSDQPTIESTTGSDQIETTDRLVTPTDTCYRGPASGSYFKLFIQNAALKDAHSIAHLQRSSRMSCATSCFLKEGCSSFSFTDNNMYCVLGNSKGGIETVVEIDGTDFYIMIYA
ncbi:uncharacterized protein [Amphiura filiformis]|uniref:uncharacterized protein n=1 Tax=Amphiura filiformis TaxID=82378 RepID=UPI003B21C259